MIGFTNLSYYSFGLKSFVLTNIAHMFFNNITKYERFIDQINTFYIC